jgi:uncharacterized protein (DUF488 family)
MTENELPELFTVGHSNHTLEKFLDLLERHAITAIADVRSQPFSRYTPHFNREALERALKHRGIFYVFLGEEFGARRSEPECYLDGKVSYERTANSELFQQGIERLQRGVERHRIALMCAEKDPLDCHRSILIARNIEPLFRIQHILDEGQLELHSQLERRLLVAHKMDKNELFRTEADRLVDAYASQASRIAYVANQESDPQYEEGFP